LPAHLGEKGLQLKEVDRGRLLHLADVDCMEELVEVATDAGQVAGELEIDPGHCTGELCA